MASPFWVKTLINKIYFLKPYVSRLSNRPVVGRMIERAFFEGDEVIYLPKDRTIQVNRSLAPKEDIVAPSEVLEHFIREASFRRIMNFCLCRDSNGCNDYPTGLGCIFLGEAARGINPEFGREASVEEAVEHAGRCREAGLVHMIGRNKLDTIWLNIGPGKNLLTVCNCCPCCCIWNALPEFSPSIGAKVNRMPGVRMEVTDRCVGCGACNADDVCFVQANGLEEGRAVIGENCRGCGRCASVCPNGAIRLIIENETFIEDAISRIANAVDVK